jgi:uracil-DNA glycosylase
MILSEKWKRIINEEMRKEYFRCLDKYLRTEELTHNIYPAKKDIFNAFKYCSFENAKVVIIGQDPYINPGQAQGLSFSVPKSFPLPPSLLNIFKELKNDLGIPVSKTGDLTPWAKQGVLLLNAVLTVREGVSNSHRGKGWEEFTDRVIQTLNDEKENLVFILWGSFAKSKRPLITNSNHFIIESVHPSPLSAHSGFFRSSPFSTVNGFLEKKGLTPIDWHLDNENI